MCAGGDSTLKKASETRAVSSSDVILGVSEDCERKTLPTVVISVRPEMRACARSASWSSVGEDERRDIPGTGGARLGHGEWQSIRPKFPSSKVVSSSRDDVWRALPPPNLGSQPIPLRAAGPV